MRIYLDTDKKQIILPWNYAQKLKEINKIAQEYGGEGAKEVGFIDYFNDIWQDCIKHSDTCVKTGQKPVRNGVKK